MNNYYYLVAGLPEVNLDDTKVSLRYTEYMQELMDTLAREDEALLRYFRLCYENRNLLSWLRDNEAELHPLGMLTADDFKAQWEMLDYEDKPALPGLPDYMLAFMRDYRDALVPKGQEENYLSAMYYAYALQSKNAFVRAWFEFQWNLNNVLTAVSCRKYGMDIASQLVGDNEIVQALRGSTARDFGLSGVFPPMESILRMSDDNDLLLKEKKLDRIQWDYLDELCTDYYFSVEVLLAYLVKLQSVERWLQLNAQKGEEIFRQLLMSMKEKAEMKKDIK